MKKSFRDRFFEKVSKRPTQKGCLVWLAGCFEKGYGAFSFRYKTERAHRFAWEMVWGAIPVGYRILHSCDNPPCVNIAHLGLGTPKDNSQDAKKKGRLVAGDRHWFRTNPERIPRGEGHGNSRLTVKKVRKIRNQFRAMGTTKTALAKKYGVTRRTILLVISGDAWKHIPDGGS